VSTRDETYASREKVARNLSEIAEI